VKILSTDVEHTFALYAVSSCSANLLAVRFQAAGDIEVDDIADASFIDTYRIPTSKEIRREPNIADYNCYRKYKGGYEQNNTEDTHPSRKR
jgi:hypothetical protein